MSRSLLVTGAELTKAGPYGSPSTHSYRTPLLSISVVPQTSNSCTSIALQILALGYTDLTTCVPWTCMVRENTRRDDMHVRTFLSVLQD